MNNIYRAPEADCSVACTSEPTKNVSFIGVLWPLVFLLMFQHFGGLVALVSILLNVIVVGTRLHHRKKRLLCLVLPIIASFGVSVLSVPPPLKNPSSNFSGHQGNGTK
jgi:prepilin signal peptidase PulO-like enzyme (type II secretory pathway)